MYGIITEPKKILLIYILGSLPFILRGNELTNLLLVFR